MTPQELKSSILQLAIQGRLVEQLDTDTPVDLSSYKHKKTDDPEFEVPDKWQIAHLESVTDTIPSKQYQILESQVLKEGLYPVISQSKEYSIGYSNETTKLFHHNEPVIVFGDHTTEIKLVHFDFIVGADGVKIFAPKECLTPSFFFYVMKYLCIDLNKIGGYSRHYKYIKNKPIFLPPLAEQKRIVARIEKLLPYIDRYEQAWAKLEVHNKRFPDDMQKSVLQLAIQGKLVEQRPEEGTGEELYKQIQTEKQKLIAEGKIKKGKPLPEITEDEVPFDIPESWKWVRLIELGDFSSGKTPTMGEAKFWNKGTVNWFTSKDMKKKYLDQSEMQITELAASGMTKYPAGTLLMVVRSGILKRMLPLCILTQESTINQDIKAYRLFDISISEYVYYMIKGLETHILKNYRKQVTTVDSLKFDEFSKVMLVPLPPLAEQKRIVQKLNEILPLCEKLK